MKKKVLAISILVVLVLLAACTTTPTPANGDLKLENGILTWDVASDAMCYEVDLGNGGVLVNQNQYDLAANCAYSGDVTVTVRAVLTDNSRRDIGSLDVTVEKLPQPIISIVGEGEEIYFVWTDIENATNYTYDAHDGNGTRTATADEDGFYRVKVTDLDEQLIRVEAAGGSRDNVVYASNSCLYRYSSNRVLDLSLIGEHPAVYYATGVIGVAEVMKVGTTLPAGTYTMTVSMYASTISGDKLTGNGSWGRRIVDVGRPKVHLWMCADAPSDEWPLAEDSIPYPDEVITVQLVVNVDVSSNAQILCHDFDPGEMVIFKDLVVDGKSVLNEQRGLPNPEKVIEPFDLSTVDNYLAYYRGLGVWLARDESNIKDVTLRIPTDLEDGKRTARVDYYICDSKGEMLSGNGLWGRRVLRYGAYMYEMLWLNENKVESYKIEKFPEPNELSSFYFDVEVKDGYIELICLDFNAGDYFIVASVVEEPRPVEEKLNFEGATNGYVFTAEDSAKLLETYTAWKKLNLTVQVQYGASAAEAEAATLTNMEAFFNMDESGKLHLYGAEDYRAVKLLIPAGTIVTPADDAGSAAKLHITNDIVLERDPSYWGTSDGWTMIDTTPKEPEYVDVVLTFKDASNGYIFTVEADGGLPYYNTWKRLNLIVQAQYGDSAEEADAAELRERNAFFNMDDNGTFYLYEGMEFKAVKLVIPAGTIITPADDAGSTTKLRITNEIVLERDSSYFKTTKGWEAK